MYRLTEHKFYDEDAFTMPVPIDTYLECDANFFLEKFGRLKINSDEADYENSKTAEKRWFAF